MVPNSKHLHLNLHLTAIDFLCPAEKSSRKVPLQLTELRDLLKNGKETIFYPRFDNVTPKIIYSMALFLDQISDFTD